MVVDEVTVKFRDFSASVVVTAGGSVGGVWGRVVTTGGVAGWEQPQVITSTIINRQIQCTHLMMGMWERI